MGDKTAKNRRAAQGFTLLEVLIGIALVSMIFVIVASALQFSVRAWRNTDNAITAMQDVAFAQSIMRQALEDVYPRLAGDGYVDFLGDAGGVRFVGRTPNAVSAFARADIELRTVETENGAALAIAFRPEFTDETVRETLIDDLAAVSFSYLPRQKNGAPKPGWTDSWAGEARLPALIKIEVQLREDDRRRWPPLIIAPRIDVDAACRYDPLTNFCQGRRR